MAAKDLFDDTKLDFSKYMKKINELESKKKSASLNVNEEENVTRRYVKRYGEKSSNRIKFGG